MPLLALLAMVIVIPLMESSGWRILEIDERMDPLEVLAVWLAADGDDTGSRLEVLLEHLQLVSE